MLRRVSIQRRPSHGRRYSTHAPDSLKKLRHLVRRVELNYPEKRIPIKQCESVTQELLHACKESNSDLYTQVCILQKQIRDAKAQSNTLKEQTDLNRELSDVYAQICEVRKITNWMDEVIRCEDRPTK